MYKNRRHPTKVECRLFCPILSDRCRFRNFLKLLSYRHTPERLSLLIPSKKWQSHFFEKDSLRSAPQLSAISGQFDARSAQSVFCHAHIAAENRFHRFHVCGCETLRGSFDKLKRDSHRLSLFIIYVRYFPSSGSEKSVFKTPV